MEGLGVGGLGAPQHKMPMHHHRGHPSITATQHHNIKTKHEKHMLVLEKWQRPTQKHGNSKSPKRRKTVSTENANFTTSIKPSQNSRNNSVTFSMSTTVKCNQAYKFGLPAFSYDEG